jgi:hypothetical protein
MVRLRSMGLLLLMMLWASLPIEAQVLVNWEFGTLPTNGVISGMPDELIGWGYTLHNDSASNWLLAFDITTSNPFDHGTGSAGPFDFPALQPGESVSVPYSGNAGLYDLLWDIDAPAGFTNSGNFTMSANWYDGDPFNGGQFVSDAGFRLSPYSASVSGVPEPGNLTLIVGTAVFILPLIWRKVSKYFGRARNCPSRT